MAFRSRRQPLKARAVKRWEQKGFFAVEPFWLSEGANLANTLFLFSPFWSRGKVSHSPVVLFHLPVSAEEQR